MSIIQPLKSDRFLAEINKYFSDSKGTYLYDTCLADHADKISGSSYAPWLEKMLSYLEVTYKLKGKNIMDLGCGAGEFTVWMNKLGYNAVGVDVDKKFLNMAGALAEENGLSSSAFRCLDDGRLPFHDKSVDIVTMFSVLEHMDDKVLIENIIPEVCRVCRGVIYILVPNRLKPSDDHTGLWFVPWLPGALAAKYINMRGKKYSYYISASGEWDVYYRTWADIKRIFEKRCDLEFPPDEVIYPSLEQAPPLSFFGKKLRLGKFNFKIGIPLPLKLLSYLTGMPLKAFYRYLNFVLIPREDK